MTMGGLRVFFPRTFPRGRICSAMDHCNLTLFSWYLLFKGKFVHNLDGNNFTQEHVLEISNRRFLVSTTTTVTSPNDNLVQEGSLLLRAVLPRTTFTFQCILCLIKKTTS